MFDALIPLCGAGPNDAPPINDNQLARRIVDGVCTTTWAFERTRIREAVYVPPVRIRLPFCWTVMERYCPGGRDTVPPEATDTSTVPGVAVWNGGRTPTTGSVRGVDSEPVIVPLFVNVL